MRAKRVSRVKGAVFCFFVSIWLPASGCGMAWERPLPAPLTKISHFGGNDFFIEARHGVLLADLVDLEAFQDLKPGMSFDQVREVLGEPQFAFQEYRRDDVLAFSTRFDGRIEVVRQTVSSEGYEGERWFLRFGLLQPCAPCYVKPPIWDVVPVQPERLSLSVSTDDGQVVLDLEEKRLVRIWWLGDGPEEEAPRSRAREREESQ
jgi:hypothetical protein